MNTWHWVFALNIIATSLQICVLIPQLYKTWKTKDTYSLSAMMYSIYPICALLWIIYSIVLMIHSHSIDNIGTIFINIIELMMSIVIFYVKFVNLYYARKMNLNENEYYKQYVKGKKESKMILKIEEKIKLFFCRL